MALNPEEKTQLIELLEKVTWPVEADLFDALCGNLISVSTELAVLKEGKTGPQILLIYRNDKYFEGWHLPGTIMQPGDTEVSALKRLCETEVRGKISAAQFIDRMPVAKGKNPGECARGQEIGLLFVCWLTGERQSTEGRFFPINDPPNEVLGHHLKHLERLGRFLQTAR